MTETKRDIWCNLKIRKMKDKILLLVLVSVVLLGCKSKTRTQSDETQLEKPSFADTINQKTNNAFFFDESLSSFYVLSRDKNTGYDYETVEINYKVVFIIPDGYKELENYIAKYITRSKTCTGCEGQERNIKVELYSFDAPNRLVMKIDKNCDELTLFTSTYKTTIYGCCASENIYEIFNYKHKSIIQADNQIITGDIPNSKIKLYFGFTKDINDTLCLGSLNYSYNSDDKYTIRILTEKKLENTFLPFSPEIEILGGNNDRKHSDLMSGIVRYTFWSLNKISNKNSINNLTIRLTFPYDSGTVNNVIDIPIVNGKLFGKDERIQEIYIE